MAKIKFGGVTETVVTREESDWIRAANSTATTNLTAAVAQLAALRTPSSSAALDFTLGNLHYQEGQFEPAAAAYAEALRKLPRFRAARVNLARVHLLRERPADAAEVLQSLVADGQGDADTFLLLGHALMARGAAVSAESAYRQALMMRAGDAEALTGLARALMPQSRPAESLALAAEILDREPLRREVWVLKCNSLLQLDRPADAANALESARRLGLADPGMLALLGDLHLEALRPDDALARYQEAFAGADPPVPRLLRAMEAFLQTGRPDSAAQMDARLAALDAVKLSGDQRREWLRLRAGLALAQGKPAGAVEILQDLLREDPLDGRALLQLAGLHRAADRLEDAVIVCERAARIPAVQVDALVLQAQIEVQRSRYAPAVELLESAQALHPGERVQHYLEQVRRLRDQAP